MTTPITSITATFTPTFSPTFSPTFTPTYTPTFTTTFTTTLKIAGMSCGSCARHIDQALRAVAGVSSVTVDRTAQLAQVLHNDQTTSEALIAATIDAGYNAVISP